MESAFFDYIGMKLNTLKLELKKWEKHEKTSDTPTIQVVPKRVKKDERPQAPRILYGGSEKVAGGDILWNPIDRQAAKLLAKAPWWAQPVAAKPEPKQEIPKVKKERKHMSAIHTAPKTMEREEIPYNGKYLGKNGLTVHMVNGKAMFDIDEVNSLICEQVAKLPQETRPAVKAAEDARKVIDQLTEGLAAEMHKFQADCKFYLEDIRQTRFAVVSETAAMTKELKDVRQFFLGSDYKDQINRLREFVDLCERMKQLKDSGFLDSVADTMLRLSEAPPPTGDNHPFNKTTP